MSDGRYVIGIDLGTTNCALAYADTGAESNILHMPIAQLVQPGVVEERPLLPSFLYLPAGANELPVGSLKLPWAVDVDYAVGELARTQGMQVPVRLVASAKSWLSNAGVDRRAANLPWKAPEDSPRISPVEASTRYLKHLADAWNYHVAKLVPGARLEQNDVILTVPASFDAVARELTVEAARAAGLERITLLEEPQAAFYAWIDASHERWRDQVEVGDIVLVCDIGGGTTDFTLIAVGEESGNLALSRIAVGDHILLGGDNMDLALAHAVAGPLAKQGAKLDAGQMLMLWHGCRAAKEKLFADSTLTRVPVTILGRGRKLVGGTIQAEATRTEVEKVLMDGFFPDCDTDAAPRPQRTTGLQELGLPYASDPAISKHLAQFLQRNSEVISEHMPARRGKKKGSMPTALLFNGGVCKAEPVRQRLLAILNRWAKTAGAAPLKVLHHVDLDRAVAGGAAYYGLARRGRGVRIRGGAARAYYVGIESSLPAVPGSAPPLKALCVVPFGMEEGTEAAVPGQEFGLVVGVPAEFRFLGSTARRSDAVGDMVEEWQEEIEELTPLTATLQFAGKEGQTVPIQLHSKVTEVGTLELWCISRDGKNRWKLEFNVRERPR